MGFLNLSLGELLGLVGAISAGVVALYLLDRSKRQQVVATLRFWTAADVRTELKHRRRIQQPWSLLLQLLSIALLLLALAGPRWGGDEVRPRSRFDSGHVGMDGSAHPAGHVDGRSRSRGAHLH